jgi:hypothetical protein
MTTSAFVQVQKQQQAKFMCSACGADRGCDCNAPAVEKLAAQKELNRQRQARHAEKKRKQKQQTPNVSSDLKRNEPLEVEDEVEVTPQELWQHSVHNMATDAVSLREYWTNNFGKWEKFEKPSRLVALARQAADEWTAIAEALSEKQTTRCQTCGAAAEFGYRVKGEMQWFCDKHRLSQNYADARMSVLVTTPDDLSIPECLRRK